MRTWIKVLSWYTIVLAGLGILSVPFFWDVPLSAGEAILGVILTLPVLALGILVLVYLRRDKNQISR